MQLMWVSGPTGHVRTVSITKRKIAVASAALALSLIFVGCVVHLIGLRVAIQVRPELARSLGGVTTEAEQLRVESMYRERLASMKRALEISAKQIVELEQLKNRFMKIATPTPLRERLDVKDAGQGGPLVPTSLKAGVADQALVTALDGAVDEFGQFQTTVTDMRQQWTRQLRWLENLPTGLPIRGEFHMTSGFGMRIDPFTRVFARHEGLDFTADSGTPIIAAADGTVTRSGWEASYGNIVEITHAEGFVTRYAHISKRHVAEGQRVKRGEHIADVGSTGRSTGPHLHYEVFHHGRVLNPVQVLQANRS